MLPQLPSRKRPCAKRHAQASPWSPRADQTRAPTREPRLRRSTERRPPLVHDDALWHEGPDCERMRKTRRHEGPREPGGDRPDDDRDGSH
ncbi:MAG TPA: hypothetical protein VI032_19740 [Burkholderiaceae bacterium]